MSILVLAEKPSVARDIARILGAGRKGEGFLEGQGYRVTWALGHLVHFAEPDEYGAAWSGRWSLAQLPMIPERWQLRTDKRTAGQLRIVQSLLNAPDTEAVICATDAGREGENIFRLIYEFTCCHKPFQRLWVSSLTDEAIRAGFAHLKPGTAFDPLAQAARARAQADWLVGMNLTRAYTVHNRVLCTIGRVQTPTLAMIVARDQAISGFVKAFFYELVATLAEGFSARYHRDGETRLDNRAEAERLQRELAPHLTGRVKRVEQKVRHNRPPPLYDLTNLQRDANRRFGLTAAQVLEQAQALYETHKLISYPRTESRHISEDMLPQLPGILTGLEHPLAAEAIQRLEAGHQLGKAYVDNTRLTDHHAILPTGKRPQAHLSEAARRVFDLVAARFVAIFLPDEQVEETRALLDIGGADFVARGSRVLDPGWKRVEPLRRVTEADETEGGVLPPLTSGQRVHVTGLEVVEKETQPPRPYDDATLLAAMKSAGREIEDDALARAMKESGLGTPATRAEIIEKLIRSGYVERQRKQLRATAKGLALIGLVAEPLRSPALTANWEQRLKDVEQGQGRADDFYRDIVAWVRHLIPVVAQGAALTPEQAAAASGGQPRDKRGGLRHPNPARATDPGLCPLCKKGEVVETPKAFGCSRYAEGCALTVWKTLAGRRLDKDLIGQLLAEGRTDQVEGFVAKTGRLFAARLKLNQDGKVAFDFEGPHAGPIPSLPSRAAPQGGFESGPKEPRGESGDPLGPLTCPKCGKGRIIEGRRGFGCDRYREGCDFVVWKQFSGRVLTQDEIRRLITTGRTGLIQGFSDAGGVPVDTQLRLDGNWQVVLDLLGEEDHPRPENPA
ncbi:MAG: DNA topoisomerase 3 [Chromatiaceae bacterium]